MHTNNTSNQTSQASQAFTVLTEADRPHMLALLFSLDGQDRNARFNGAMSDDQLRQYVASYDFSQMHALGLFSENRLCALGELYIGPPNFKADKEDCGLGPGEVALMIGVNFRGRGVGARLFKALQQVAHDKGLTEVYAMYQIYNRAMRGIALKAGFTEARAASDVTATIRFAELA